MAKAGSMGLKGNIKILVAGGLLFIVLFVAAFIFSFADSGVASAIWVALITLLPVLALLATRSPKVMWSIAPLMLLLVVIAVSTDMGGNAVFNRLSTPLLCRGQGELKVERRVQHPYAGKVVTQYVFFCQQEGIESRVSEASVTAAHTAIYGGYAFVLFIAFTAVSVSRRSRT